MDNILIVDDNLTYIEGLRTILQEQGYLVDYALGVLDALEKIKNNNYGLIFVDMKMHDFTGGFSDRAGLNLVPLIKSKSPNSKIVILTAGSKDIDAVETLEQGAVKYLRKGNFSVDYLLKLTKQLLESQEEINTEKKKVYSDNKFIRWVIERSYGILDEVLAGLLLTALVYFIGRFSGLLSTPPLKWFDSKDFLAYIFIVALALLFIVSVYFILSKRSKK
ncbi:MAG: response regulator [Methylococcales bacterium]|nr:response regulator [Methylococcales bacterium]